ncbi:extracellular solute-binding protein [Salipaludibacillus daqingensis]|uniref:extracellular solute-binding protein n=1 Tax=Salipaludibacillus daqingensis TaxID=3041001 RepID=UPI00247519CC|nr:extracellular solute-binding protein [Salipaludibacillus daqingensis]
MEHRTIHVLAVADPAVFVYTDETQEIIQKYEQEMAVQIVFDIVPFETYYSRLLRSFEEDLGYDVMMIAGHLWLKDFVKAGRLFPFHHPMENDVMPLVRKEMYVDGTRYLYPSFCDGHILVYRKSVVEKAYGSLPSMIDTDTIIEAARACHGHDGVWKGIALKGDKSEIFLDFLPYLRQAGENVFSEEGKSLFKHDKSAVEALDNYCSLRDVAVEGTEKFGNDDVREQLQKRNCAMAVTWGGQLGFVMDERMEDREDIGFAVVQTAWNVTWSFAIHRSCTQVDDVHDFLQYLTSLGVDKKVGRFAGAPVRKSSYEADRLKYPWYDVQEKLLNEVAEPLPVRERMGEFMEPFYDEIWKAFVGEKSTVAAIQDVKSRIEELEKGSPGL